MSANDPIILTASQCKISNVVWDLDWLGEGEIQLLQESFQCRGPFVYMALVCEIGKRGGFFPRSLLSTIKIKTGVELATIEAIVEQCAVLGILEATEHGITSRRVQREIEKFMRMKLKKKFGEVEIVFPWSAPLAPNAPGENVSALGAADSAPTQERQGKVQERKEEARQGKASEERFTLALPPQFNTPGIIKGFQLWERKSRKNGRPLDAIGAEAILCRFGGRPKALERALIYSSQLSKCFNVIEDPNFNESRPNPSKQPVTNGGRALITKLGLEDMIE